MTTDLHVFYLQNHFCLIDQRTVVQQYVQEKIESFAFPVEIKNEKIENEKNWTWKKNHYRSLTLIRQD